MERKLLKILIFSASGLLIFYFLLTNIELADFKKALVNFNWRFSFLAFGLYILMNFSGLCALIFSLNPESVLNPFLK